MLIEITTESIINMDNFDGLGIEITTPAVPYDAGPPEVPAVPAVYGVYVYKLVDDDEVDKVYLKHGTEEVCTEVLTRLKRLAPGTFIFTV